MKFIPELSVESFEKVLTSNHLYADDALYKEVIDTMWPQVKMEIYQIDKPYTQLNYPDEGGVTGYFSLNMTKDDLKLVKEFLDSEKVDVLNTRAFKENGKFIVTVGSIKTDLTKKDIEFKGQKFDLVYGEFSAYLKECNNYLKEALKYVANDAQKLMVEKYIEHYESGSIE